MPFKATPQQAFLVFSLVFADTAERREPKQSDVKLAPKMREELVKAGLLSKEKRGRAQHLVITSKAYEWAAENLGTTLAKTEKSSVVLQQVLFRLKTFIGSDPAALKKFAGRKEVAAPAPVPPKNRGSVTAARRPPRKNGTAASIPIREQIRAVYFALTNGALRERVLLKDLRSRVAGARSVVDDALLAMQKDREVVLMGFDDPNERTAADDEAALHIAGNPRHVLYLQG
jgi:hypothetical protein